MTLERAYAEALDKQDELASFHDAFHIAEPGLIYLDGNSLGRLPHSAIPRIQEIVSQEWGTDLIRGWGKGWYEAPLRIGEKVGQLLGAAPGQLVMGDSTSVNLFKLVVGALRARPGRSRIVSDEMNFPSDLYILQGCIELLGNQHHLDLIRSTDGITIERTRILDAITEETALVTLSHITFKSGFMHDAAAITEHAHRMGALVLWDLSHSVGAVPVELDAWEVDLAVGCSYKYLNGGPGAPAFLYVRHPLQASVRSPLWGWFGQHSPFSFDLAYTPTQGIAQFQVGTPPLLSLLAIEPALDLLHQAGMARLRQKSLALSEYLITLFDAHLAPLGFTLGSPRDASQRGSHVSICHPQGYQINRALIEEMGVLPDFREPDNIRLGLTPLYTTFTEVWEAVERICQVVADERHLRYPDERLTVT